MSIWSVLLAMQGFEYDGPAGVIGFSPIWEPDNHASFFSTAEGWGLFSQQRGESRLVASLDLRFGELSLNEIQLAIPERKRAKEVYVRVSEARYEFKTLQQAQDVKLQLEETIQLKRGDKLEIAILY